MQAGLLSALGNGIVRTQVHTCRARAVLSRLLGPPAATQAAFHGVPGVPMSEEVQPGASSSSEQLSTFRCLEFELDDSSDSSI